MPEPENIRHESGLKEVVRVVGILVVGILVVGAVVLIAGLIATDLAASSNEGDFGENAVMAEIIADSDICTADFPLEISLTNVSDVDVLDVGYMIQVSDAGHSTKYHSFGGTDRIIPPDHVYRDCYAIPPFMIGTTNAVPAEGIPYTLASPKYEITISGTRSRGED